MFVWMDVDVMIVLDVRVVRLARVGWWVVLVAMVASVVRFDTHSFGRGATQLRCAARSSANRARRRADF